MHKVRGAESKGIRLAPASIRRVLIIHTAYTGDIILTTPLIRETKRSFPEASLSFLAIPSVANILETNPHLDALILYDKRGHEAGVGHLLSISKRLRRSRYDLALLPHRSLRTALLAWAARIPRRIGFDIGGGSFLHTLRVKYRRDVHEIDRNLDLLAAVGGRIQSREPEVFPDQGDRTAVEGCIAVAKPNAAWVALAPGSIWTTKRWPADRFAALASALRRNLSVTVFLVGGPKDAGLCSQIASDARGTAINCAGRLTLRQSAELISRCRVLVSNDSAPLHLGVAVGTQVVAIFGPTVPEFGFRPFGEGHVLLQKNLPCRPCGIHGGMECPIGTHECMEAIQTEEVYAQVMKMLLK